MNSNLSLVVFYNRPNKYSFNALLGALETSSIFDNIDFHIVRKENQLTSEIKTLLREGQRVVVAFSFSTTQLWDTISILSKIEQLESDNILLIAGGPHPSGDPKGTLKIGFDFVVKGEGEETFIDLLKSIIMNDDIKIDNVEGIAYLGSHNDYVFTGNRKNVDLNTYPPFSKKLKIFGPIEITRGCPYICYFCQTPQLFGPKVRHRSVESICENVKIMNERNLFDIRFITPNALSYGSVDGIKLNLKKLEQLLSEVKKLISPKGRIFLGSFPSEVRPEHVTEESIKILRDYVDNDNLIIGAQSGSQIILDKCHRGHSYKDVYSAVNITLKAGFKANVDFIFGLPGESKRDVNLTLKMMADLVDMGARVHTHTFIPLPKTPFSKSLPGKVTNNIKKAVKDLTSKGMAYGDWEEQEIMSKKISNYLINRSI
jgi:B12-binding domain/radical SAM domain protein